MRPFLGKPPQGDLANGRGGFWQAAPNAATKLALDLGNNAGETQKAQNLHRKHRSRRGEACLAPTGTPHPRARPQGQSDTVPVFGAKSPQGGLDSIRKIGKGLKKKA